MSYLPCSLGGPPSRQGLGQVPFAEALGTPLSERLHPVMSQSLADITGTALAQRQGQSGAAPRRLPGSTAHGRPWWVPPRKCRDSGGIVAAAPLRHLRTRVSLHQAEPVSVPRGLGDTCREGLLPRVTQSWGWHPSSREHPERQVLVPMHCSPRGTRTLETRRPWGRSLEA